MTDQRTLKKIIAEQRAKIEKFKQIAVHVVEHCCTDCEDTTVRVWLCNNNAKRSIGLSAREGE